MAKMLFEKSAIYLKKNRLASNLTQRELAKRLDMKESQYVSNWERALCLPPGPAIRKMVKYKIIDKEILEFIADDFRKLAHEKYEKFVK